MAHVFRFDHLFCCSLRRRMRSPPSPPDSPAPPRLLAVIALCIGREVGASRAGLWIAPH